MEILKLDQVQFLVKFKKTCYKYFLLINTNFQILIPRILQALLTSFADYRFYKWSGQSKWSVFMIATSWFWFYTGTRTLANTVETALSTIALSYFPWENSEKTEFLWPVSLICLIRPTAAIQWIPLCIYHIKKSKFSVWEIVLKRYLLIGLVTASYTIAIDSYCHGSLIFTPWEFVKANVIDGIGSFYGEHKWHWYVTAGLPTVLGITTLPFIGAIVESIRNNEIYPTKKIILGSISFSVIVYSLIAHKEFRFILSLLPMCLFLTSEYLGRWSRKASKLSVWIVAIALFVGNVFPAAYIGFVHQKGTIDVMPVLGKIAREYKDENGAPAKLLFLMPCHSTPYYSHIHYNVSMRFLTCEPNFMKKEHYLDEADKFYQDPAPFLRSHFPVYPKNALPTHLILFDILVDKIQDFLINYKLRDTLFHSDVSFLYFFLFDLCLIILILIYRLLPIVSEKTSLFMNELILRNQ